MTPVQTLDLDFRLRGHAGHVHVEVSANDDPRQTGHALVARNFDAVRFVGFPVLTATIAYPGRGLNAAMGWLQVIHHIDTKGKAGEIAVDRFPLGPEDSPLYSYGHAPTFFDAPANPDHPDGTWQADTWLIAVPDVIRTRRIAALVGFRWGYRLTSSRPELLPLDRLEREHWHALLPTLRGEHPRWTFSESVEPSYPVPN